MIIALLICVISKANSLSFAAIPEWFDRGVPCAFNTIRFTDYTGRVRFKAWFDECHE
jgi:hypothetical protein